MARTGGALLLSSLYVYLHASITIKDRRLHDLVARRSARPALLGAILVTAGGLGWYAFLPESSKAALESAAVLSMLTVLIFALTVAVFVLLYVGPYRNPGWLSPGFAATLTLLGVAAFSTGEFIREAVRKPYVVYNVVLGSQIYPDEVAELRQTGFLGNSDRSSREGGSWTRAFAQGPRTARGELGQALFMYHCNDCHATTAGYSAVAPLVRGWPRPRIVDLIEHLDAHTTSSCLPGPGPTTRPNCWPITWRRSPRAAGRDAPRANRGRGERRGSPRRHGDHRGGMNHKGTKTRKEHRRQAAGGRRNMQVV